MKNIIFAVLSFVISIQIEAAMVRVVEVQDGRTLVVELNGQRETIRLAGIDIVDEARASDLLQWTLGTSWILAERQAGGEHFVFRSPDALFVNRELVLRGFARATQYGIEPESNLRVTYLGDVEPGVAPIRAAPAPVPSSKKAAPAKKARTSRPRTRKK
jgi:hypothetical protein